VILDDADDLNEEAANCFLKTLEEPPPRSVLVLVGSTPDRQLPTVVSRCQVVRFSPLPPPQVEAVLRGQGVEDPALLARLVISSAGSPGRALELADPALWEFRRNLIEGLAGRGKRTAELARSLVEFVEEAGKETLSQRRRARLVLRPLVDSSTTP
jgi:DNA polymerase-3 subunit delta'